MKTFNFFEKLWEHSRTLRRVGLVLVMCLMAIPHVWAGQTDFINKDADDVYIKYVKNGGDATQQNIAGDGQSDIALGTVSSLVITEFRAVAKNKDSKTCAIWMTYGINTSRDGTINSSVSAGHNTSGYADWTWDSYWGCQQFKNTSVNLDLLNERDPGNYWYDFYFTLEGNTDNSAKCYSDVAKWWNNGGKYHMSYTIPSRNLTVSRANTNGTVSSSQTGVKKGHAYTITATPNTHYAFVGWTTSDSHITIANANSATTTVTFDDLSANATVTATFAPKWAIAGGNSNDKDDTDAMGNWGTFNNLTYTGTANTYSGTITLAANTTYRFKVVERGGTDTYWGYGGSDAYHLSFVGQSGASEALGTNSSNQENLALMSAGAGTYTFTWNSSSHTLTVDFPTVTHPSTDYIYYKDYDNYDSHGDIVTHVWGGSTASTGDQRMPVVNSFNFDGTTYFYAALGNNTKAMFAGSDNTATYKTEDLNSASSKKGKFYDKSSNSSESTRWQPFTATLTLDHQGPLTNTPAPNTITVTYGASTNLTGDVITTKPTKSGYTFGGYCTQKGGGGLELIGSNENVVASVSGFTDASKNWIKTGATVSTTIYAKWTQTVELNANGGASNGSVTATFNGGLSGFSAVGARTGYTCLGYYTAALGGTKVINSDGTLVTNVDDWTDSNTKWIHADASTLYAHWQPNAASGRSVYKFVIGSVPSSGNVCTSTTPVSLTTADGKLSTLEGGTLTVKATGNTGNISYHSNSLDFNGGNSAWLVLGLDDKIQAGDVIRYRYSSTQTCELSIQTSKGTGTNQISLPSSSAGANKIQTVTLSSAQATAFASLDEVVIIYTAGSNRIYLDYFEILRPYKVTLNASENEGTINDEDEDAMYFAYGESQLLPRAEKDDNRFTGWFTSAGSSSEASNPYTATGSTTLYAHFESCSTAGSIYSYRVKNNLTTGNFTEPNPIDLNVGNYLTSLDGGTLTGYRGSNNNYITKVNGTGIQIANNGGYLQIDLDCPTQAGDTIKTIVTGNTAWLHNTTTRTQTMAIAASANTSTYQKQVIPAGLVNKSTLYMYRGSGSCDVLCFEIIRPAKYVVTHDLTDVTKTSGATTAIHKADYTAVYEASSGYELPSSVTVTRGETDITTYCTWTQASGTLSIPGAQMTGNITISITGDAAAPTYGITNGDPSNGSILIQISSSDVTEGEEGDQVDIVATPNTGYSFSAWSIYKTDDESVTIGPNAATASTYFTMPAYAVTVDASFTINSWDLSWNFDGGETSSESYTTAGTKNYGTAIIYPANNTMSKTGHSFTGWSTDATTMPDNDLEITALWSANTYNVASHTLSNVTLSSGGATGTNKATYGTNYTATFAANTGYNLPSDVTVQIGGVTKTKGEEYSWNSSTGELSINGSAILGNIAISVTAVAKTYTLKLDKNGGNADGEAVATYNSHTLASITDATCTNLTHYSLDGYYTAADGGVLIVYGSGSPRNLSAEDASHDDELEDWLSPYTGRNWIKDDDDVTLYAHWRLYITLNHNADHHGTGSYGSATAIYNGSALKTISHTTGESGYSLLGYYTTADGGTKILNADGSFAATNITDYISGGKWIYNGGYLTLYAHWGKEFDVTYNGNGNTGGTAPSAVEDQIFGTEITVATKGDLAKTGYSFVGWNTEDDGSGTFYAAGSKFTLIDNITLYAQWGTSGDCGTSDFVIKKGSDTEYQGCMESSSYNGTATSFTAGSPTTVGNAKMTISNYDKGIKRPGEGNTFSIVIEALSGYELSSVCWAGKVEDDGEPVYYYWDDNTASKITISPQITSGTGNTYNAPSSTTKFTAYYVDSDGDDKGGIWWRNVQVETCPAGGTTYTVSFANMTGFGGSATLPSNITGVPSGSKIAEPVIPSATGYVFGGWYKEGACSNAWDFDTDEVTAATTLYAKWVDVSGTYTFHYGGGEPTDNTWVIIPFTSDGTNYRKIENFVVPNATKYPSFFVGYEGAYDTENAKSTVYDWDDTYGYSNDGRMPIKHEGTRLNSQSNCPIAGNGNTAEGVKGKLRISVSGTITTNCNVGFYPNGFGLTWNRETTALHATPSPEVFETDVVTLTAAEAAGNFEVKLATEDSYVAYSRTATETAEDQLNARKVEGETYDIAAGTVGRFQINLSKKEDNYGLRFVPLQNRSFGSYSINWTDDNYWTLWRRPNIDEDAYINNSVYVNVRDAQAKKVIISKYGTHKNWADEETANDGRLYIKPEGGLLIATTLKKLDSEGAEGANDNYFDVQIESDGEHGTGALITGSANPNTQAYVQLYTLARNDASGHYVNQFFGIPLAQGSIYDFYNTWLYVFDRALGDPADDYWYPASRKSSSMSPFVAYDLLRRETSPGIIYMDGALNLPGTSGKQELLCDDGDDNHDSNPIDTYLFANSWTAPIDVKTMKADEDFVGAEATIYIFNAGSPQDEETAGAAAKDATNPGQWISLPVQAADVLANELPLTVIPSMQAFAIKKTSAEDQMAKMTLDYDKHVYTPAAARAAGIEVKPMRSPGRFGRPNVMKIYVAGENGYKDNLFILERADFSEAFDNGWDGRKIFGESYTPQLYAVSADSKMSIDAISIIEGTVVGFRKGSSEEVYTISFKYDGEGVYYLNDLQEQEATLITDDTEYTFNSTAGDAEARFIISATPIQKTPTDIDNVQGDDEQSAKVRKVIINDHVYIIRGGNMYSIDGAVVK